MAKTKKRAPAKRKPAEKPSNEARIILQDETNTVAFSSSDPERIAHWVAEWLKDPVGIPLLILPPGKLASERATHGVFLVQDVGCYHDWSNMPPLLLRRCANKYEAVGYADAWAVDDPDHFPVKLVPLPIDVDGNPIEEGGAE